MSFTITKLSDEDMKEVRRLQKTKATAWEAGKLSAWSVSVGDHEQRREISEALRFERDGAR